MGKLTGERLEKIQSLRTRCLSLVDVCDTLISGGSKEAAEKVLGALRDTFLPEGSIAFKMLDTQGEKAMAKLDAKRRKDLKEARDSCKALLTSIEKELAGDSEDGAEKSASLEFHSPDMKAAILDVRRQPVDV
jgi:hypothetical protein